MSPILRFRISLIAFVLTWGITQLSPAVQSLWPSVLALVVVFLTRSALLGLFTGAAAGALLLSNGNPYYACIKFFEEHLVGSLQSSWNISVLIFTMLMGGFVGLIEAGGGLQNLVQRFLGGDHPRPKRVLWSTVGMGLVCFFDGLANALMVGRVMRPLADRAGISREKLAYIVDSTSSPIACVALISTWSATQLALIKAGMDQVGAEGNAYLLFIQSIPVNFYCWFTLVLVILTVMRNWDIGHMREVTAKVQPEKPSTTATTAPALNALLPLLVLLVLILSGLYFSGSDQLVPGSLREISEAFGNSKTALVLLCSSAVACVVAALMNRHHLKDPTGRVFAAGLSSLLIPALILIAAWCLTSTLRQLGAADTLTQLLTGRLPPALLPALVFITGAMISFFTGTSWGTMGVLMPLAVPLAITLGGGSESHILVTVIAAVFSGAVFGDHCSPISDTTLVSSIACDVQPMDHVRAQLPYALIAAALATLVGFIPAGYGAPGWMLLPAGLICLVGLTRIKPRAQATPATR